MEMKKSNSWKAQYSPEIQVEAAKGHMDVLLSINVSICCARELKQAAD